ncbi:CLUMA_CG007263, isoform A [Clunio marinus]|uniref:CLUMA_CG007263, isoform A n=1 Tax=Clunio marinus TaxID=568069 RepID=A0A1J1I056_9DIPT|nr:CLUMA_CG007263, isoform A [Clunio marinus]
MDEKSEPVEPLFKYLRIACDLREIVKNTSISCISATTKILIIGNSWGDIHILDHEGNVNSHQKFPKHIVGINQISVDSKGEWIGSCSDDGKVHITCLYAEESGVFLNLERQIKCIELDPMYHKSSLGRRFILGDYQLTLYEKTFLKGYKPTVLSDSEGLVNAVKWNGQFVAWASGIGVRVYDLNEKCSLGLIKWEEPKVGKLSDFRCNLRWRNASTLLIGWVDSIRICVIRKRNLIEVSTRNLPGFIVDPISTFPTEFYVCGLAPLENNQLVVLGVPKERDNDSNFQRPILCAIRYECNVSEELCTDSLTLKGYQNYTPNDYSLECLIDENKYFIVSPKDIVSASLYEIDDRVKWLIEHELIMKYIQVISAFLVGVIFSHIFGETFCGSKNVEKIDDQNYLLVVLILTAPKNILQRNTIRETWLNLRPREFNGTTYQNEIIFVPKTLPSSFLEVENVEKQRIHLINYQKWLKSSKIPNIKKLNNKIKHLFAIGTEAIDETLLKELEAEQKVYHDLILINDLKDSYSNLTLKLIKSLQKLLITTPNFKYLLKCDDDSYVKLDYLSQDLINYHMKVNEIKNKKETLENLGLYWGFFNGRANVKTSGQWRETNYNLCDRYLPYALGGGYVISKNIATTVATLGDDLIRYTSEDISMGVWLSSFRNIHRRHDPRFDTAYLPRQCKNYHLILHKKTPNDMREIFNGNQCFSDVNYNEKKRPPEYFYDCMFEKALNVITEKGGKYTKVQITRLYVDHLLSQEKYEEAAKLCLRIFENNKDLWEEEVYKFVKVKQLRSVSQYLPRTNDCKLNPQVYEMVLYEYLKLDRLGFLELIKEWPPNLYNTTAVINAIHDHFEKKDKNILLEALAILYSHEQEYDKALTMYLKLQHKDVFQLIKKHNLYNAIRNMIVDLIKLDCEKAISMLLERNKISPEIVVAELENHETFLYMFLDALDKVDSVGKFDWKLINLYAKYDRDKMLSFLKRSRTYPLQDAYELCKVNLFYPEMVYLLDRMGDSTEALTIIIKKLKDVTKAIEFCREHNDLELWEYLVNESVDKPEVITKLLDGIAGFIINPEMLIDKIQQGQKIPGLKNALMKMLNGFNLQVSVHDGCNQILQTDYFNLHEKLVKQQEKGIYIGTQSNCCLCQRDILVKDKDCSKASDVIVFNCHHFFHESCVPEKFNLDFCAICMSKNI